jgi:hypothetical protein
MAFWSIVLGQNAVAFSVHDYEGIDAVYREIHLVELDILARDDEEYFNLRLMLYSVQHAEGRRKSVQWCDV